MRFEMSLEPRKELLALVQTDFLSTKMKESLVQQGFAAKLHFQNMATV